MTTPSKPTLASTTRGKGTAAKRSAAQKAKVAASKQKLNDAKAASEPKVQLIFHIDGKPVSAAQHNRLAGISRATGRNGGKRLTTDQLRALLRKSGIANPDREPWKFTLPNDVTIGAVVDRKDLPAQSEKPKATRATNAKKSKGSSTQRIERLNAAKEETKALREWKAAVQAGTATEGDRPATPALDAIEAEKASDSQERKAS